MGKTKKGGEQGMYVGEIKKENMTDVTVDEAIQDFIGERRKWLHRCCQWLNWCVCGIFMWIQQILRSWFTLPWTQPRKMPCDQEDNLNAGVFINDKEENQSNIDADADIAENEGAFSVDAANGDAKICIDENATNFKYQTNISIDSTDADYNDTINKDAVISKNNVDVHVDAHNSVKKDTDASITTNRGKVGAIIQGDIRSETFNRHDELTTIIENLLIQTKIKNVENEFAALCKAFDDLNKVIDVEVKRNLITAFTFVKEFMKECWSRGDKKINMSDKKSLKRVKRKLDWYKPYILPENYIHPETPHSDQNIVHDVHEKMGAPAGGSDMLSDVDDSTSKNQNQQASDSSKNEMPTEPTGPAMLSDVDEFTSNNQSQQASDYSKKEMHTEHDRWKNKRCRRKRNATNQKSMKKKGNKLQKFNSYLQTDPETHQSNQHIVDVHKREKKEAPTRDLGDSNSKKQDPPVPNDFKERMPSGPDVRPDYLQKDPEAHQSNQHSFDVHEHEKLEAPAADLDDSNLKNQDPPVPDEFKERMLTGPNISSVESAAAVYTNLDDYFKTYKKAPLLMQPREMDKVKTKRDRAVKGIRNIGNTCYMNSTIHCLNNTSPLVTYFITDCYQLNIRKNLEGRLVGAFAKQVKELWLEKGCIDPWSFKNVIGQYESRFAGYAQQDSHEFLSCLLDGMHKGLNKVEQDHKGKSNEPSEICWQEYRLNNQSILVELFHGQFKTTIRCNSCNAETAGFQIFMYLFLPIPENAQTRCTLDDCLEEFSKEMSITGDCLLHSSDCENNNDTIMKQEIWKLPHILIITLRRFADERWGRIKINTKVDFETSGWNLSKCPRPRTYNLYAVSNHYGGLAGGHYTACCKNPENGNWYTFNDESVSKMSESDVKTNAAYVLYYTSIDHWRYNPASVLSSK